jgi:hypothetical protein
MQADTSAVQPDSYEQALAAALQRLDYDTVDTFLHALCDAWEESRQDQAAFVERVRALLLALLSDR